MLSFIVYDKDYLKRKRKAFYLWKYSQEKDNFGLKRTIKDNNWIWFIA